jgi:hypothetical protein
MAAERTIAKAYKRITTVQPGHRIEVIVPEVEVGQKVEVIVVDEAPIEAPRQSMLEFLDSLPPRNYTKQEWEEIERQFQEERDSWDR